MLAIAAAVALMLACMPGFPAVFAAAATTDYAGHWAENIIAQAIELGVAQGYGDGTFQPDATISRAEFATMLWRALGSGEPAVGAPFLDLASGSYYVKPVTALYAAGIVTGRSDEIFAPDDALARQEGIVMLARAYGLTPANANSYQNFSDAGQVAGWARDAVSAMYEAGYLLGRDGNAAAPASPLTRAETAALLMRVIIQEGPSDGGLNYGGSAAGGAAPSPTPSPSAAPSSGSSGNYGGGNVSYPPSVPESPPEPTPEPTPEPEPRNLSLRRAALHSSAANYNNTAHLATDGLIKDAGDPSAFDSSWVSGSNNQEWIYVDLGADATLSEAIVHWGENYATEYSVQSSADAVEWKTAADGVAGAANAAVSTDLAGQGARYVRVLCKNSSGPNYIVKEIEVMGVSDWEYSIGQLPAPLADGTQYLSGGNWKVARASEIGADGAALSSAGYDDSAWLPARVPGTVLASYLKAGAIPDPNFDDWQLQVSDSFFTADFWYRDSFEIPSSRQGKRVFLNFDAINWKADVYFNGRLLPSGLGNERSIEGAFIRGSFDVTQYARYGEENYLAVLVLQNENPGPITLQSLGGAGPNGGPLGADNPTIHAAAGWDWVPTIRGRDSGIYEDVYVSYSGGVELLDPWMETDLEITELPGEIRLVNLAERPGVTVATTQSYLPIELDSLHDGDMSTQWTGADEDGASFTLDLGEALPVGTVMISWGGRNDSVSDWDSQHAQSFTLEQSLDGAAWAPFDPASPSYAGHSGGSDAISCPTGGWPPYFVTYLPVTLRYLRFTGAERRELPDPDGGPAAPAPTIIKEIRVYSEEPGQVTNGTVRNYSLDASRADLTFRAEVRNSGAEAANVTISGTVNPGGVSFEATASVPAGATQAVEISGIYIDSPELWWPNTYGGQFLYDADVQAFVGGAVSDSAGFKFGVREFAYPLDGNSLAIYCNGTRVIARGGNWGMDDGMLLNTPEDYDNKVRLHAEENFTMIRNWVGMTNHRAFYDAADKYGVLIWDDFWLANPSDGPSPNDNEMFLQNAIDKVRRNRSHAALAVYCGRNESSPPAPLLAELPPITEEYDGTRYYFPNSAGAPVGSGGGYSLQNPRTYFGTTTNGRTLRSEYGIPNIPSLESVKRIFTAEHLWPINDVWGIHDFCLSSAMNLNSYLTALKTYIPYDGTGVDALGSAYTLEEFARVAQMINYENHRGLFEGLYVGRSNGLLMWMSQSSWPSFVWQTYDYYLDTNGGYFGVKAGNQPIHAVWDPRNDNIVLSNATPASLEGVTATVTVYGLDGKPASVTQYSADIGPDENRILGVADFAASPTDLAFIRTVVADSDGNELGNNFYWHNRAAYQDYAALNGLARADLDASVSEGREAANGNVVYEITVSNGSGVPAPQIRIRGISDATGADILPTFYSDNYFGLMPGESKTVTAEFDPKYLEGGAPHFEIGGWNVVEKAIGEPAPAYAVKSLSFVKVEGGANAGSVSPGDTFAKLVVLANADTTLDLSLGLEVTRGGVTYASTSRQITRFVAKGSTATIYSEPVSINLGELADLSEFGIEASLSAGGSPIRRQKLNPWIPTWTPLPSLNERDRVVVDDFDGYAGDAAFAGQYAMGGSANTLERIPTPFAGARGLAFKETFNLPGSGLGQYTGRHGTISAEYGNADTLSFWIQTDGVFKQGKADTGEYLLFQFNSRGTSYELQFAFLAELGLFDARDAGPQFITVPTSLITPKDSAGYPGAAGYASALFDIGTLGNFGVFLNTSGAVKSPQNATIVIDDVKFFRSAPIIDSIKRQRVSAGDTLSFAVEGKVMDGEGRYVGSPDLRYELVDPPSGASIGPLDGVVTFSSDAVGTHALTVRVSIDGSETLTYGSGAEGLTATGPHPYVVDNTFTTVVPVTVE